MVRICMYISRLPERLKVMIVSLSLNLVLFFEENLFIVAYIFLIVRICASWSDRPFIMGDIEGKFLLLLSKKYYKWQHLSYLELLLQN